MAALTHAASKIGLRASIPSDTPSQFEVNNPPVDLPSNEGDQPAASSPAEVLPLRRNDPQDDLTLVICYMSPSQLKPPTRKLRKHTQRSQAALGASIAHLGLLNPILVDANDRIICRYGRRLAPWDLGLSMVRVICAAHLSEKQKRRAMGATAFAAQYQQQPTLAEGLFIKHAWRRYCDDYPETFETRLVSWDTASTLSENSDWSVGTVWGLHAGEIYLIDVVRKQFD